MLLHSETPNLTSQSTPTPHPTITVPMYAPPGMAESEISFDLWKQQNRLGQNSERKRPPMLNETKEINSQSQAPFLDEPLIVPYVSEPTGAALFSATPMKSEDVSLHPLPKAQPAWGSSTELLESDVKDSSQVVTSRPSAGARVDGSRKEGVQTGGDSPRVGMVGQCGSLNSAKRDQIASEW